MSETQTTFIRPGYRRTSTGHKPIDGVQFHSYKTGILQYARISEDGQIFTNCPSHGATYRASVIGYGPLLGPSGKPKRFQTEEAAAKAAIKVWRRLQGQNK